MGLQTLIPLTGAPGQLFWCWCWEGSTIPSCPCHSCSAGCSPEQGVCKAVSRPASTRTPAPRTRQDPHIRISILLTCLGSSSHTAKAGPSLVTVCPHAEASPPAASAGQFQLISEQPHECGRQGYHCSVCQLTELWVPKISSQTLPFSICNLPTLTTLPFTIILSFIQLKQLNKN